jgi:hypothetical protein
MTWQALRQGLTSWLTAIAALNHLPQGRDHLHRSAAAASASGMTSFPRVPSDKSFGLIDDRP